VDRVLGAFLALVNGLHSLASLPSPRYLIEFKVIFNGKMAESYLVLFQVFKLFQGKARRRFSGLFLKITQMSAKVFGESVVIKGI
jgi:hypothetical protein